LVISSSFPVEHLVLHLLPRHPPPSSFNGVCWRLLVFCDGLDLHPSLMNLPNENSPHGAGEWFSTSGVYTRVARTQTHAHHYHQFFRGKIRVVVCMHFRYTDNRIGKRKEYVNQLRTCICHLIAGYNELPKDNTSSRIILLPPPCHPPVWSDGAWLGIGPASSSAQPTFLEQPSWRVGIALKFRCVHGFCLHHVSRTQSERCLSNVREIDNTTAKCKIM